MVPEQVRVPAFLPMLFRILNHSGGEDLHALELRYQIVFGIIVDLAAGSWIRTCSLRHASGAKLGSLSEKTTKNRTPLFSS